MELEIKTSINFQVPRTGKESERRYCWPGTETDLPCLWPIKYPLDDDDDVDDGSRNNKQENPVGWPPIKKPAPSAISPNISVFKDFEQTLWLATIELCNLYLTDFLCTI